SARQSRPRRGTPRSGGACRPSSPPRTGRTPRPRAPPGTGAVSLGRWATGRSWGVLGLGPDAADALELALHRPLHAPQLVGDLLAAVPFHLPDGDRAQLLAVQLVQQVLVALRQLRRERRRRLLPDHLLQKRLVAKLGLRRGPLLRAFPAQQVHGL